MAVKAGRAALRKAWRHSNWRLRSPLARAAVMYSLLFSSIIATRVTRLMVAQ